MTPEDIKRLHYYERQFLRTQDFQDEQTYHIEMRRRHLIAHHTWGIIAGLDIAKNPTSGVWAVQPGMAVDGYGREIVVFEPEPLNLAAIADQLSGQGLPALLKIWIAYQTELANPPATGYEVCNGKDQFTRIRESFQLIYKLDLVFDDGVSQWPHPFQDLPDASQAAFWPLYLGTITWNTVAAQNIIQSAFPVDPQDNKARRHDIGVVAAEVIAPDNTLLIRGRNDLSAQPPKPSYSDVDAKVAGTLQVTNNLTVGPFTATTGVAGKEVEGKIDVIGKGAALGFVNRSLPSWSTTAPQPGDRFAWYNPDGNARLWTEKTGDLLTVTNAGSVGIGITNPTHKFHTVVTDGAVGLFESKSDQAFLRFQTSEGFGNRVEITNRAGGRLSLWTAGGGDVLNITKAGDVGIGTVVPTPGLKLDIQGDFGRDNGPATLHLFGSRIGDIGNGILSLASGGGTIALNGNVGIGTGIAPLSARLHLFQPGLGTVNLFPLTGVLADFRYDGGDDHSYWFVNTAKTFGETRFRWDDGTTSQDLLVINNNGNVGIGTSNPSLKLDIQGDFGRNNGAAQLNLWESRIGDTGGKILFLNSASGGKIELNATEIKQNGIVIHASSKELKQNIVELSSQESVELLSQLNSVKFNYKADSEKKLCLGFIAEDIPDVIATSDRKGFAPTDILALLTKVVQEQQKAISTLTAKVNQLESQIG